MASFVERPRVQREEIAELSRTLHSFVKEKKIIPNYEEFEFAINGNGSGFIVGNGKYVITNNHVIADAEDIIVRVSGDKEFKAKVIGADPLSDIAVLQLEILFSRFSMLRFATALIASPLSTNF